MAFALVQANTITQWGALPAVWNDGTRDWDLRPKDPTLLAALGWREVVESARPADTATTTSSLGDPTLVGGIPTRVWTVRPWTADELTARAQQATATRDRSDATDLAAKVGADIGPRLTGTEVWPAAKSWRTLAAVKAGELTTTADLARIIVWLVPACYWSARLARKAYRLASGDTTDDTNAN